MADRIWPASAHAGKGYLGVAAKVLGLLFVTSSALFLGLLSVMLGVGSVFSMAMVCFGLLVIMFFIFVVVSACRRKEWALFVFLALSVFLIDATFRQRELTAQSMDAQTFMKLCIWGNAILIALLATPGFLGRLFHGDIKWLSCLALLAIGSTVYSLTPAYTFGGGFAAVAYCALAVCAVENLRKEQILFAFLLGLSSLLGASLLMYVAGGGMSIMEGGGVFRLGGLTGSPNSLGRAASLTMLLLGVLVIYGRLSLYNWRFWLPAGMAVICLVLSDSRTSMAVVIAAFGLYFLRRNPRMAMFGILGLGVSGFLLLNLDLPWHEMALAFSRTGRVSDIFTLTGRTEIWSAAISAFWEKPILGYGFGSTKVLLPEVYRTYWGFTVSQAHNLYIQTAVTLGVVGLSFVLIILWRQVADYFKHQDVFKTAVLGFILIHGLTEPGPIGVAPNIVTFFWALSLCWDRLLQRDCSQDVAGIEPVSGGTR